VSGFKAIAPSVDIVDRLKQFAEAVSKLIDRNPPGAPLTINQPTVFVAEVHVAVEEIVALRHCLKHCQKVAIGRMVGGMHSNEARLQAIEEACRIELLRSGGGKIV